MATIKIDHAHGLDQAEALRRARAVVEEFGARLKADVRWNGPHATFKGTGFSGEARVETGKVQVSVELGLLLRPMRGKIETRLGTALRERFA